jgi:putative Mg2+ transporter-C (MgtC) family protein
VNELGRDVFLDPMQGAYFLRVSVRLLVASFLGGLVGLQRSWVGKPAGVRTHAIVALGAALIVTAPIFAGIPTSGLARVIQGLVEGIGFLGGGAILKLSDEHRIRGLTTAASIWLTAAIGLSVGLGLWWPALVAVVLVWVILNFVPEPPEHGARQDSFHPDPSDPSDPPDTGENERQGSPTA